MIEQKNYEKCIEFNHFSFAYKGHDPLFDDCTLSLKKGVFHVIRGRNGVGKSTLFNLIQGKAIDQGVRRGMLRVQGDVGAVIQRFDDLLVPEFSYRQNLICSILPRCPGLLLMDEKQADSSCARAWQMGINTEIPVRRLSGGQRQILAILMVLQRHGDILLLDEPTAALDDANVRLVLSYVHELVRSRGITVLIITHDEELVAMLNVQEYIEIIDKKLILRQKT